MTSLHDKAQEFADELTATVHGALGSHVPAFVAEQAPEPSGPVTRVAVHPVGSAEIPLTIDSARALSLIVDFQCRWDHKEAFLAVSKASMGVVPRSGSTPLFRYEFHDAVGDDVPCAHLHVHAHRDEFVFALFRGGHGKPAVRAKAVEGTKKRATPQLSEFHFALGGPRMRPCLEDVLQMLRVECSIDVTRDFTYVIEAGRARWRRRQVSASVRDAPGAAATTLREMGYRVDEPVAGPAPERLTKLTRA